MAASPATASAAIREGWSRRSTIWWECHWSPRMRIGKRAIAVSIAVDRKRPAGTRIEVAAAAAASRTPAPARMPLNSSLEVRQPGCRMGRRPVQADHAGRDEAAFLAEQLDPQLVAAGRGDAVVAAAAVPVEGEEVVALEEAVAGQGDDDLAARLDDLDGGVVGAGDAEADPLAVEAAVAVGGEGATGGGAEGDAVEDEGVALQPLRPGEGRDRGEDEKREDQAGRGSLSRPRRHCLRRRSPRPAPRPRPSRCRRSSAAPA